MGREEQIVGERLRKVKELNKLGVNPYPYKFEVEDYAEDLQKKYEKLKPEEKKKDVVKIAGRLMSSRDLGKIAFDVLSDSTGSIQLILQDGETDEKIIAFHKKYVDIGDFVGVEGSVFRTKRGELSVMVKKLELLSKSILPLPAKWHGLQDKEERYRKRYLDLIMNPEVKEVFRKREKILDGVREFMKSESFKEVDTPLLQPLYGGAEAQPFITKLNALDMTLYMSISPEIYLKKLLVGGMDKVFTICKNFRNEGIDRTHNPEFTMMEAYAAYWDYNDVMKMTEKLLETLAKKVGGGTKLNYQGKEIDFKAPFKVIRIEEAIKKYAGVDPCDAAALKKETQKLGFNGTRDEMIQFLFDEKVEEHLIQPTFVIDYPKSICPLTKEHRKNEKEVERFELFVNGMELANAYSELNDPIEQEKRLREQLKEREKSGKFLEHLEANKLDEDFIDAMKHGMPPAGGIGIGIDRLVMFLTDSASIRDVILFPFMKPLDLKDGKTKEENENE